MGHGQIFTTLLDRDVRGGSITTSQQSFRNSAIAISPTFTMTSGQKGLLLSNITWSGQSLVNLQLDQNETVADTETTTIADMLASTVHSDTHLYGVKIGEIKVFGTGSDATTQRGTMAVWLSRNASNELQYYVDYQGINGTGSGSVVATISLTYFSHGLL